MGEISPFSGRFCPGKYCYPFVNTGPLRGLSEWRIAPMFPDTDLPLALIMEEILGWEKKEDSDTEKEDSAS